MVYGKLKVSLVHCLAILTLLNLQCLSDDDPCDVCIEYEECVNDECQLAQDVAFIDGTYIFGNELYKGITVGCGCLDTLALSILETNDPHKRFKFNYKSAGVSGVLTVWAVVIEEYSEDDVLMFASGPFCLVDGTAAYPTIRCRLYRPDSIQLSMALKPVGLPNVTLDSCTATLYR